MSYLLWIPAASFFLCLILTPAIRELARCCGLVDRPDGRRKLQHQAVPVSGGLAILISAASVLSVALLLCGATGGAVLTGIAPGQLLGLFLGSLLIAAVGVADDCGLLRGRHKLLGQMAAAAVVIAFGVEVRQIHLFSCSLELGLLSAPFTLFFLLGSINSLNLIDGMDGLLGVVALVICGAFAMLAILGHHWTAACAALALSGALMGFLRYNLPPASVYLGDCGSMVIGLVVGVLAIQSSLKAPATVALAAPLAVLTIPIFDTTAAILRRKLTGRSLYSTDRGHIHHCLLHRGLSRGAVLVVVSGLCLVTVAGSLASLAYRNELLALLSASVVVAILVVFRLFGHVELRLLQRRLAGVFLSLFSGPRNGSIHQEEVHLQGSVDWGDYWARLTTCAIDLELTSVRLDVNAPAIQEGYHARWGPASDGPPEESLWKAAFPLVAHGHVIGRVEISGLKGEGCLATKILSFSMLLIEIEKGVLTVLAQESVVPGATVRSPESAVRGQESGIRDSEADTVRSPVGTGVSVFADS